ncbi:type II toxin-antitoxin system ParD family antitoxin [Neorhizobium alkalisoli]|uniref:type II toxin-antitoxin system ParD family antitoxin n=1 Tax=Neorhizobium alkalisoli TaxID=528178 RepID=UPI000CFA2CA4|nr:type II toxin-antitoxin system ParD family antitoxin [Neorhizobium alkalisoli]
MTEIHLSDKDKAFIEEQVKAGVYKDANEAVAVGLRQLQAKTEMLKRLIQEGLDDVEAGRVHSYASAEEFSNDIKRMADEKRMGTGY